jgi:hypothetical protein
MTVAQVLDTVARLDHAATQMLRFIRAGGGQFQALMAYDWAKQAGHYANTLIDLAERGDGRAV